MTDFKILTDLEIDNPEHLATRDGFGEALLEIGKKDDKVVVLTADVAESTRVDKFKEAYPTGSLRLVWLSRT